MGNDITQALDKVIREFGRQVIDRPDKLRASLSDVLATDDAASRRQLDAIVAVAQAGVATRIGDTVPNQGVAPDDVAAWLNRLAAAGLSQADAVGATTTWAQVLAPGAVAGQVGHLARTLTDVGSLTVPGGGVRAETELPGADLTDVTPVFYPERDDGRGSGSPQEDQRDWQGGPGSRGRDPVRVVGVVGLVTIVLFLVAMFGYRLVVPSGSDSRGQGGASGSPTDVVTPSDSTNQSETPTSDASESSAYPGPDDLPMALIPAEDLLRFVLLPTDINNATVSRTGPQLDPNPGPLPPPGVGWVNDTSSGLVETATGFGANNFYGVSPVGCSPIALLGPPGTGSNWTGYQAFTEYDDDASTQRSLVMSFAMRYGSVDDARDALSRMLPPAGCQEISRSEGQGASIDAVWRDVGPGTRILPDGTDTRFSDAIRRASNPADSRFDLAHRACVRTLNVVSCVSTLLFRGYPNSVPVEVRELLETRIGQARQALMET